MASGLFVNPLLNYRQWKRLRAIWILESNGFGSRPTVRKACNNPVNGGFSGAVGFDADELRKASASTASRVLLSTSPFAALARDLEGRAELKAESSEFGSR
jgi:hypothetical protein